MTEASDILVRQHPVDVSTSFEELAFAATKSFVRTIVAVDDNVDYTTSPSQMPPEAPKVINEPSFGSRYEAEGATAPAPSTPHQVPLDARALTNAASHLGIVCMVLEADEGSQADGSLSDRLTVASSAADALIVDWQLNSSSDGSAAVSLIRAVIQNDIKTGNRPRLVIIYTSEPSLDAVLGKIKEGLTQKVSAESIDPSVPWLHYGSTRIACLNKAGGLSHSAESAVSESELPQRVLAEFARMTSGLITNLALAALGAIREDSFRMLSRFHDRLDRSWLSHRGYVGAEDAELLLVALVGEEIAGLLDAADVRRWVEQSAVEKWSKLSLSGHPATENDRLNEDSPRSIFSQELASKILQRAGDLGSVPDKIDGKSMKKYPSHTALFGQPDADAADVGFTQLTQLHRLDAAWYPEPRVPRLSLGSIVRLASDGRIFVCLMPLCDTVRIPAGEVREFPFLKLVVDGGFYQIEVPLPDGNAVKMGAKLNKAYDLARYEFYGDADGTVRASRSSDPDVPTFRFSDRNDAKFEWIGELRFPQAQKIATDLAAQAGRVGTDNAAWIQTSGKW